MALRTGEYVEPGSARARHLADLREFGGKRFDVGSRLDVLWKDLTAGEQKKVRAAFGKKPAQPPANKLDLTIAPRSDAPVADSGTTSTRGTSTAGGTGGTAISTSGGKPMIKLEGLGFLLPFIAVGWGLYYLLPRKRGGGRR